MNPVLGLDIGRVLIQPGDDKADTSFLRGSLEDALRTPPNDGMFEAVPRLVEAFGGRVWLVSKCGPTIQDKTRRWLERHRFFERTGIDPGHLKFCLRRPEKAGLCADLGITHFIDDRIDVLSAMEGVVAHRFLFGPQEAAIPADLVSVPIWGDAPARVLPTL